MNKIINITVIVYIAVAITTLLYINTNTEIENNSEFVIFNTTFPINVEQDSTLTKENLIIFLDNLNVRFPEIVYAQCMLETGGLSSYLCHNNNNLFGMTSIGDRINRANGSKEGFAYFNKWQHSVVDYAIYQALYLNKKDKDEYYVYLTTYYAEDPNYISKLQVLEQEYFSLKTLIYDN
ncbi:MAG: hypothetical protein EOL97_09035 [Spirochaetia bacterium]|nr:hypothetical protein [Spirochaetia bacterium]